MKRQRPTDFVWKELQNNILVKKKEAVSSENEDAKSDISENDLDIEELINLPIASVFTNSTSLGVSEYNPVTGIITWSSLNHPPTPDDELIFEYLISKSFERVIVQKEINHFFGKLLKEIIVLRRNPDLITSVRQDEPESYLEEEPRSETGINKSASHYGDKRRVFQDIFLKENLDLRLIPLPKKDFDTNLCRENLRGLSFGNFIGSLQGSQLVQNLKYRFIETQFDFTDDVGIRSLGGLLKYLLDSQAISNDFSLANIRKESVKNRLAMNKEAIESLEIFKTDPNFLFGVSTYKRREGYSLFSLHTEFLCTLAIGRRVLKKWFLNPTQDKNLIFTRHQVIDGILQLFSERDYELATGFLKKIYDILPSLNKFARRGRFNTEVRRILTTIQASLNLKKFLAEIEVQEIKRFKSQPGLKNDGKLFSDIIDFDTKPLEEIQVIFEKKLKIEGNKNQGNMHLVIQRGIDGELDSLKDLHAHTDEFLEAHQFKIIRTCGLKGPLQQAIRVMFASTFGYAIALPKSIVYELESLITDSFLSKPKYHNPHGQLLHSDNPEQKNEAYLQVKDLKDEEYEYRLKSIRELERSLSFILGSERPKKKDRATEFTNSQQTSSKRETVSASPQRFGGSKSKVMFGSIFSGENNRKFQNRISYINYEGKPWTNAYERKIWEDFALYIQKEGWMIVDHTADYYYFKDRMMEELDMHFGDLKELITSFEDRMIKDCRETVSKHIDKIVKWTEKAGEFDALLSFALIAREFKLVKPSIVDEMEYLIKDGRNLLAEEASLNKIVPNDYLVQDGFSAQRQESRSNRNSTFCSNKFMLVTGPNYSGKSVYLKQVGQIVFLAHIGAFVPAAEARIGITDQIISYSGQNSKNFNRLAINDLDVAKVTALANRSTNRTLVLLDELGKHLPFQYGLSLLVMFHSLVTAQKPNNISTLDMIPAKKSYEEIPNVIVTAHFPELKMYSVLEEDNNTRFMTMKFLIKSGWQNKTNIYTESESQRQFTEQLSLNDDIEYLYKLAPGFSIMSFALHLAKKMQMDENILARALTLLKSSLNLHEKFERNINVDQSHQKNVEKCLKWIDGDLQNESNSINPFR